MTKIATVRMLTAMAMAGASLWPVAALAQVATPPDVPAGTLPSREELERGVTQGALSGLDNKALDADVTERAPCPLAAPEFADITFTLRTVTFTGTEAFPATLDLSSAWGGMAGQTLPVAAVCEIRDRAATMLRQKGYLAAVQVPPQTIEDGNLTLDVLAARIVRLQVKGDAGANEGILLRTLQPLTEQAVFNSNDAERALLLARDIPGLDTRLTLRPVEGQQGQLIGEISVRRIPFTADVMANNYNAKSTGPWSLMGRMRFTGLTGMADATTLTMVYSGDFKEQQVFQADHQFRVGSDGLRLGGEITYAITDPTFEGRSPFKAKTLAGTLRADYPVIRSRTRNLFASGGLDIVDQDVKFGDTLLTRDKVRVLWARADFMKIDTASANGRGGYNPVEPKFSIAAGLEARQGLAILNAGTNSFDGDPTAFVLRADGDLSYRPTTQVTLVFQPRAQWSPHALLSYEEFGGGNYSVGRGYDPGEVLGDSVLGFRSEVRFGSAWPLTQGGKAFQPYGFFDALWLWNEDSASGGLGTERLFSTGVGVRANLMDRFRLDAGLAVPLRDTMFNPDAKGDVRGLISISMQLAQ